MQNRRLLHRTFDDLTFQTQRSETSLVRISRFEFCVCTAHHTPSRSLGGSCPQQVDRGRRCAGKSAFRARVAGCSDWQPLRLFLVTNPTDWAHWGSRPQDVVKCAVGRYARPRGESTEIRVIFRPRRLDPIAAWFSVKSIVTAVAERGCPVRAHPSFSQGGNPLGRFGSVTAICRMPMLAGAAARTR